MVEMAIDASWALAAMTGIGILCMYFIINKFIVEGKNPYAFTQYFDRSLVKVKMYEVAPAGYSDQVSKPLIHYKGIGMYGNEGLFFKNLYPVNKDFFVRAEQGFMHFYYKSGGHKSIIPVLLTVFYSDYIQDKMGGKDMAAVQAVDRKGQPLKEAVPAKELTAEEKAEEEKKDSFKNLGFLIPSKEQLEIMTDNYIDNFMTRQQSVSMQISNSLEILTKAIVPIGLFVVMSLAILSVALVFASNIVNYAIDKAVHVCPAPTAAAQAQPPTQAAPPPAENTTQQKGGGVFQGILPLPSGGH